MNWKRIFIIMLVISLLTIAIKLIEDLPWWIFILPCAITGGTIYIINWKIPHTLIGFITGFLLWPLLNIFFHFKYDGPLFDKLGFFYSFLGLITSGLLTGLLMALTINIGFLVAKNILSKN